MSSLVRSVVLLAMLSACTEAGSESTAATPPPATQVSATSPPTTVPVEPDGLPTTIIGTTGVIVGGESYGTRLVRHDRRTGEQVELLTSEQLITLLTSPPGTTASPEVPVPVTSTRIATADLSPDGRQIAVVVTGARGGQPLAALLEVDADGSAPPGVISSASPPTAGVGGYLVRYSPDGTLLATAGKTLAFWTVATGRSTATDILTPYPPEGFDWSPDGRQVAWGNYAGRSTSLTSTVVTFARPGDPSSARMTEHGRPRSSPWFDAAGEYHGSAYGEPAALDTDATRSWVLGVEYDSGTDSRRYLWWSAADAPTTANPLAGVPADLLPLAW